VLTTAAFLLLGTGGPAAAQGAAEGSGDESQLFDAGGGDRIWVFAESPDELGSGGEFHIYVDPETHPEARASFARFSLGPGGALPVHRHDKTEEISYFVSGTGVVITVENGETVEVPVREGNVWYVPPGAWHAIRNTGDQPLTLVFATIPNEKDGLLSFFRRIGARPGTPAESIPPEEFAALAAEHDLILRPPSDGGGQ
jgi:mannose-6-phosphate isomerase-like protein (cupin superfamily)